MKKLAMAALLLATTCAAQAGGSASASMEVSFVIRAACSVRADSSAAPQVECSKGTSYQLVRNQLEREEPMLQAAPAATQTAPPQQPSSTTRSGETWQIVF